MQNNFSLQRYIPSKVRWTTLDWVFQDYRHRFDDPQAMDDIFPAILEDSEPQELKILSNDFQPMKSELEIIATQGNIGNVLVTNNVVIYTPFFNMSGNDTFLYTITDQFGSTSSAIVNIEVVPVNDPPINTTPPSIIGKLEVGQILEALPGEWNDDDDNNPLPIIFTYQWRRSAEPNGVFVGVDLIKWTRH